MRWVLPGGATLRDSDERRVACRPLAAVRERTRPVGLRIKLRQRVKGMLGRWVPGLLLAVRQRKEQLETIKLVLEIGAVAATLIGGLIALIWRSR